MAQRGCDACPDIDNGSRAFINLASGGIALYHLDCRPDTANDTAHLHTRLVQQVHAREQDTGTDPEGFALGSPGEIRSSGQPVAVAEMEFSGRTIDEVNDLFERLPVDEVYAELATPLPG